MKLYSDNHSPAVYCKLNDCNILAPIIYRRTARIAVPSEAISSESFSCTIPSWFRSEMRGQLASIPSVASILSVVRFFIERNKHYWRNYLISTTSSSTTFVLKSAGGQPSKPLFKVTFKEDGVTPDKFTVNKEVHDNPIALKVIPILLWYYGISSTITNVIINQSQNSEVIVELDTSLKALLRPTSVSFPDMTNSITGFIPASYNDSATFEDEAATVNTLIRDHINNSVPSFDINWLEGAPASMPQPVSSVDFSFGMVGSEEEQLLKWR